MSRRTVWALVAVLGTVLTAGIAAAFLDGGDDDPADAVHTSTTTEPTSTTPSEPTTTVEETTTTSTTSPAEAVAAGTCPPVPARARPDPHRPVYDVEVTADPRTGVVEGVLAVSFTPDLDTDRLVFRLWPNGPRPARAGARLSVDEVTVDGAAEPVEQPDPTTLVVRPGPVRAGETVITRMTWRLEVPGSVRDRISRSGDTLRLGSFLPLLAWEQGVGWAEAPATAGFAEATSSPTADWTLRITVPDGYDVLASAPGVDGVHRITAARDFAVSVGRFEVAEATVEAPVAVTVRVGVHAGIDESPQAYLDRITASLVDFAARYGPYPWPTLSFAITPGMTGGIEFPAHVMQGPGSIGRTTPHEVAHQWFYGLVGNDQGRDPWLDEGLATYAEGRFEGTLGSMQNRSIPSSGAGRAGEPMTYWESRPDAYYRSVYVQTAAALGSLGDPAAVDCALAHFVARHANTIATQDDLMAVLTEFFPGTVDQLGFYGLPGP